ncbi:MAG: winged helix-turn-helix domain-containing protein [Bryobacteraceae bacterium]
MPAALQILRDPAAAAALLKPDRLRILSLLAEPDSASGVARRLGMPRQTVNYHLRELEKEGLVEFVESRQKGNCLERVLRARAAACVISQDALAVAGELPVSPADRFSAAYLASTAARAIRDLAALQARAAEAGQRLATMTIETEIRFSTASARNEFTAEITAAIAAIAAKYHDERVPGGRRFRLMLGAYPAPSKPPEPLPATVVME